MRMKLVGEPAHAYGRRANEPVEAPGPDATPCPNGSTPYRGALRN
jgi:hypothetical protein